MSKFAVDAWYYTPMSQEGVVSVDVIVELVGGRIEERVTGDVLFWRGPEDDGAWRLWRNDAHAAIDAEILSWARKHDIDISDLAHGIEQAIDRVDAERALIAQIRHHTGEVPPGLANLAAQLRAYRGPQIRGRLKRTLDDGTEGHCAMGVVFEIAHATTLGLEWDGHDICVPDEDDRTPIEWLADWLGVGRHFMRTLSEEIIRINDEGRATFPQIADFIERRGRLA